MSYQQKKVIDPPGWFGLEKYNKAYSASFEQWFFNIVARVLALEVFEGVTDPEFSSNEEIEKCRNEGFANFEDIEAYEFFYEPGSIPSISTLTVDRTLFYCEYMADKSKLKTVCEALKYQENFIDIDIPGVDDLEDIGSILNPKSNSSIIEVNLDAPIDVLMEQFNNFILKEKEKKKIKIKTGVTVKDLEKWADLKLIAYLDLILWKKQNPNKKISNTTIAKWLYGDSGTYEDYRIIEKNSKIVLEPSFLFNMSKQKKAISESFRLKKTRKKK